MSVQDLKDLILGWIPDNVMRLINPERARNAYNSIIDFFWDVTGDKSELETTDKSSLVNAINELNQKGFDITEKILTNGQSYLFPAMIKGGAFVIRIIENDMPSPDGMVWLGGYDGVSVGNDTLVICLSNSVGGSYSAVGHQFVIINQGKDSEVIFVDALPDEHLARTGVIYVLNSNNAMYVWDNQLGDYVLIGDVIPGTLNSSTEFIDGNNNVVVPEANKLYFDTTTEEYYRWDGVQYVPIVSGGGSNLTLEQARQNGNVLEGDVITKNGSMLLMDDFVVDDYWFGIKQIFDSTETEDNYSFIGIDGYQPSMTTGTTSVSLYDIAGLVGNDEFDKQGDRRAFAQIADVEDALEDYIKEPTTDGTSGQVLTTDGSGGRSWTTVSGVGAGFSGLTGDVTAGGDGVTTVEKLSEASAVGKNQTVVVLPDGTIEGEDIFELWVYDDTVTPYSLTDLQTNYPTSAGRLQGFEVRCRLLTPPTTYRKESDDDDVWIKIEGTNVV